MSKIFTAFRESGFVKGLVYMVIGALSFPGLAIINKLQVNGMDKLKKLPKKNVLFVSNHQTYFAEVICFFAYFLCSKLA